MNRRLNWYEVPVIPGHDEVRIEVHRDGEKCDACGVRDDKVKRDRSTTLMLCVDFRACSDRTRADDLTMMALDRSAA